MERVLQNTNIVMSVRSAPEMDGPLSAGVARDRDGRILDEYLGPDGGGERGPEGRPGKCRD